MNAEVVIVGSGVIGASIAYHLTTLGIRDVVVVDRESASGNGSTSRATGGFRVQFGTAVNVRLSLLSRAKLLRFPEEIGSDSGLRQHGYLFLASSEAAMSALRAAQEVQHASGATEPRMITAAEAAEINPAISLEGVVGGAWCAADGFIRAMLILRGYEEAAKRNGVRFLHGEGGAEVLREGNRIAGVRTKSATWCADAFVNAGGAWAGLLSDVPVAPLRRCVVPTVPTDALPETMPMTIWAEDGYHLRMRDGRALLLWPDAPANGFDMNVDDSWIDLVEAKTRARVPALAEIALDRAAAWGGLYEMSPDKHAIVGRDPKTENLFLANGSSGHGVMHAPAIGQIVAEMIAGAPPSIDVHELRPSRFAEGQPVKANVLL